MASSASSAAVGGSSHAQSSAILAADEAGGGGAVDMDLDPSLFLVNPVSVPTAPLESSMEVKALRGQTSNDPVENFQSVAALYQTGKVLRLRDMASNFHNVPLLYQDIEYIRTRSIAVIET